MTDNLAEKTCIPCQGGVPALSDDQKQSLLEQLDEWSLVDNHHLSRTYQFKNFVDALAWANRIGEIAEEQNHHPDLHIAWGKVQVDIWTHKIDDLVEADYILAAKIDQAFSS